MACYHPIKLPSLEHKVPCGRCIGCGLERSRTWALRCVDESLLHKRNCAVTLTYRDDALIYGNSEHATLYPKHLQNFWKELRKKYGRGDDGKGIRYFACGEYGTQNKRPHYHACIFNFDFDDKYAWKKAAQGYLYRSESLEKIWRHGDSLIGDMSFETAAYVARYILEKWYSTGKEYCEKFGIEREFVRMSRRPAIGLDHFYSNFGDMFPADVSYHEGKQLKPPRYYLKKLKELFPTEYDYIKQQRKLNRPSYEESKLSRLATIERVKISDINNLNRSL